MPSLQQVSAQLYDAISRGATAVLAERLLPVDVPQCVVPDTRAAFGKICHHLANNPSQLLKVVFFAMLTSNI